MSEKQWETVAAEYQQRMNELRSAFSEAEKQIRRYQKAWVRSRTARALQSLNPESETDG